MVGTHSAVEGGADVGVAKIVADEEERLVLVSGEGVGEAVSEIELRRVLVSLAKLAIGEPGDFGLIFSDRFDCDALIQEKLIESQRECGAGHTVGNDGSLQ